jgi:hypothetical protein
VGSKSMSSRDTHLLTGAERKRPPPSSARRTGSRRTPSAAVGGSCTALPASVGGPDRLLLVPDLGNTGASSLALRSTTSPTACSCT